VEPIVFGGTGTAIILVAYLAELFGHVYYENKWFLTANVVGSALLAYYSLLLDNAIFLTLNCVWALGSLYELWRMRK
jgi:uncharacterized membrane protein YGL010W